MKTEIDASIEQYGQENAPPPWSVFTMPNAVGPGNMHIVQKVFEGPFEFDIIYSSGSAESPVTCKAIFMATVRFVADESKPTFLPEQLKRLRNNSQTASRRCLPPRLRSTRRSTEPLPNRCSRISSEALGISMEMRLLIDPMLLSMRKKMKASGKRLLRLGHVQGASSLKGLQSSLRASHRDRSFQEVSYGTKVFTCYPLQIGIWI
jgi:hypothetical protein